MYPDESVSPILIYISTVGYADVAHKAPEQSGSEASYIWDKDLKEESSPVCVLGWFLIVCVQGLKTGCT